MVITRNISCPVVPPEALRVAVVPGVRVKVVPLLALTDIVADEVSAVVVPKPPWATATVLTVAAFPVVF